MKKLKLQFVTPSICCLFFIFFFFGTFVQGQSPSTQGTEFYVAFMKNGYKTCNAASFPPPEHLTVIVSSRRACQVTVYHPNWSDTRFVAANGVITIEIPEEYAYSEYSELVENKGFRITSTDTISLFIANEATYSFDASFVLPTTSLLDEYIIQGHVPMANSSANCPGSNKSAFIIIATEDNTTVDITLKAKTEFGRNAGSTFSVNLSQGQSYQVISYYGGNQGDFSGSVVKARDCKKISVFNGNVLTTIPETEDDGADHIFEQAMPVAFWGKAFVVTSSAERSGGDIVRITASENGTVIRQNGSIIATINAGATHSFQVPMNPGSCFIESSLPCALNLYQTTSGYDNSANGDPSMVWISPVEQQINDITFSTFEAQSISIHYVNIVTNAEDVATMRLDGVNIASHFSSVGGNADYMYARVEIEPGSHRLQSSSGFTAHVYGYGYAQGYAYSVGSSTIDLRREIYVNQLASYEVNADHVFCQFTDLNFHYAASGTYEAIRWEMGDGTVLHQDSVTGYHYANGGTYTVRNIAKLSTVSCTGSLYDTVSMTFTVKATEHIHLPENHCVGFYTGHDQSFMLTQDTTLIDSSQYYNHCEITHHDIFARKHYRNKERKVLCNASELPLHYAGEVINGPGEYEIPLLSAYGCDSIIDLVVIYEDTYVEIARGNADLCESGSLTLTATHSPDVMLEWSTGETASIITIEEPGNYSVTVTNQYCTAYDAITFPLCDFIIYIPNAISPCRADGINDLFQIPWLSYGKPLKFEIFIYNRWGTVVFHSTDPDFQWDGRQNGDLIPDMIYNYYIRLTDPKGEKRSYKGIVTVL